MKHSIHRYFRLGLISFMAYPALMRGDTSDTLNLLQKTACDDYFDAIEVTWIKDPEVRRQAAALLQASHLTVCYGAQPRLLTTGLNPNAIHEAERQQAEATLLEAIDEAREFGAGGVAFLSGTWEESTKESAYAQLLKTTRTLCDAAARHGMMIELEVFDFDIAKKSLIGPAPLAARFAADMRTTHANFGLLLDLSHIPMTYETPEIAVRTLRPFLTHFHIGNAVCADPTLEGYGDEHQRFGFPGSENDVPQVVEFLRVLRDEGFFRKDNPYVLSFEVKPWKNEDPDIVVANAKRVLNRAWALLDDNGNC